MKSLRNNHDIVTALTWTGIFQKFLLYHSNVRTRRLLAIQKPNSSYLKNKTPGAPNHLIFRDLLYDLRGRREWRYSLIDLLFQEAVSREVVVRGVENVTSAEERKKEKKKKNYRLSF